MHKSERKECIHFTRGENHTPMNEINKKQNDAEIVCVRGWGTWLAVAKKTR